MNKIIENDKGQIVYQFIIHCSDTIEEIKEDVEAHYVVVEKAGNFVRLHLVTDFSEDEALLQVDEYLREKEGDEESHLITAIKVSHD